MPISHARRMNLIALALLITALLAFWTFQFLPWYQGADQQIKGWKMWSGSFREIFRFRMDEEIIAAVAFVTSGLMIFAGPFIMPILHSSRWFWWLTIIIAALAVVSLAGISVISMLFHSRLPGSGMICLLLAQVLFLAGLLFIRRERSEE